jgi:hypothetical protein
VALVIAIAAWGVSHFRKRFVHSSGDLVSLLPPGDVTTFFVDVRVLRQANLLGLFSPSQAASESDYQTFVRETGFDYARDLDRLAGSFDKSGRRYFALQGRFDWRRFRDYATHRGGKCDEICVLRSMGNDHWISFAELQPDVLVFAVSDESEGVRSSLTRKGIPGSPIPADPVWIRLAQYLLKDSTSVPAGVRLFLVSMQSADDVVLSVNAAQTGTSRFQLRLEARCPNTATAQTIVTQLQMGTKTLQAELAREKQKPDPADLSGFLTSGSFAVLQKTAVGTWPVSDALLDSLRRK